MLDDHRATRSRAYLNAQIDAGAQAVMVFDTWGGVLAAGRITANSRSPTCSASWRDLARERERPRACR